MTDPGTARVLIYDIETAPNLGYTWGKRDQNVIEFKDHWHMLSVAWKWLGEKETHVLTLLDFPEAYAADPNNDIALAISLHTPIQRGRHHRHTQRRHFRQAEGADQDASPCHSAAVAVQGDRHAEGRSQAVCLHVEPARRSMQVPQPATQGGCGGFATWLGCLNGDADSWRKMAAYNVQDVKVTEKLYLRLLPWIPNHPNLAVISDRPSVCPRCGVGGQMQARGWHTYSVTRRRKFQCQACGGYCAGRKTERVQSDYVSI